MIKVQEALSQIKKFMPDFGETKTGIDFLSAKILNQNLMADRMSTGDELVAVSEVPLTKVIVFKNDLTYFVPVSEKF